MAPRWSRVRCATPASRWSTPGLHQTPEQIVDAAIQEDADAIGLSVLSGAHLTLFPKVVELLPNPRTRPTSWSSVAGIIPDGDIPVLEAAGVAKVFTPGTPTHDIVDWVSDAFRLTLRERCARVRYGRRTHRIVAVDLARESMPVEHRLADRTRCDGVTDRVDRFDPRRLQAQPDQRAARGRATSSDCCCVDEDDPGARQRPRLAELVDAADPSGGDCWSEQRRDVP